jgi:hypothetical protein
MWQLKTVLLIFGILLVSASLCQSQDLNLTLDYKTAEQLASLPLECYSKEFPYKSSIVMNGTQDVQVFGLLNNILNQNIIFLFIINEKKK